MKLRFSIKYLGAVALTIVLGIGSRKFGFLPAETGDALYAVMIFFLLKTIIQPTKNVNLLIAAFAICVLIELSQLVQTPWLNAIRAHKLGALMLGNGFLWVDIFAYAIGVLVAFIVSVKIIKD